MSAAPDQGGGRPVCAASAQQTSVFCEVWSKSFEGLQKKIQTLVTPNGSNWNVVVAG